MHVALFCDKVHSAIMHARNFGKVQKVHVFHSIQLTRFVLLGLAKCILLLLALTVLHEIGIARDFNPLILLYCCEMCERENYIVFRECIKCILHPFTEIVGSIMNLINGTHDFYEKKKYAFNVLSEYNIITCVRDIKSFCFVLYILSGDWRRYSNIECFY